MFINTLIIIQPTSTTASSIALVQAAHQRGLRTEILSPRDELQINFDKEYGFLLRSTGIDYCDQDLKLFLNRPNNQIHSSAQAMLHLRGKSQQAAFFQAHHLAHPVTSSLNDSIELEGPFVVKPERSLGGLGQVFIQNQRSLTSLINALKIWKDERFIVQQYIEKKSEWRFFFCADDVKRPAVLLKNADHWQGNRGHQQEKIIDLQQVPSELLTLASKAFKLSQLSYAGIDIIETPQGEWLFLEVNAVPGFQSFQERGLDVAARIVNLFH